MIERTPAQFRAIYDDWSKTAPANDSDIIPDKPRVAEYPKHAGMCHDLKAMLAWRDTKESRDPLQTNFLQAGMDDELFDEDRTSTLPPRDVECEWEDRPTIAEMQKAIEGVAFKVSYDRVICYQDGGFTFTRLRERLIPDLDDPSNSETIECWEGNKKSKKPRVDFGGGYKSTIFNKDGDIKPPSKDDDRLTMQAVSRLGRLYLSVAESDEVYPRGSVMYCGFRGYEGQPRNRPSDQKGQSERFFPPPEISRLNPLERLIAAEDAVAANDNLRLRHVQVLDAAITAKTFKQVGEQFGYGGKTAERQGKRLVLEASAAFSETLQGLAA